MLGELPGNGRSTANLSGTPILEHQAANSCVQSNVLYLKSVLRLDSVQGQTDQKSVGKRSAADESSQNFSSHRVSAGNCCSFRRDLSLAEDNACLGQSGSTLPLPTSIPPGCPATT